MDIVAVEVEIDRDAADSRFGIVAHMIAVGVVEFGSMNLIRAINHREIDTGLTSSRDRHHMLALPGWRDIQSRGNFLPNRVVAAREVCEAVGTCFIDAGRVIKVGRSLNLGLTECCALSCC